MNGKANPFEAHQMRCERGLDNLEDMIDVFWEHPIAFALFVLARYVDEISDAFAGRIYDFERQPSALMGSLRTVLKRTREYGADDYSIPIGSRFHRDRAPLWAPDSPVPGTEEWVARGAGC